MAKKSTLKKLMTQFGITHPVEFGITPDLTDLEPHLWLTEI
jgi:hypothetical protein